jgi:hypothetical protein
MNAFIVIHYLKVTQILNLDILSHQREVESVNVNHKDRKSIII